MKIDLTHLSANHAAYRGILNTPIQAGPFKRETAPMVGKRLSSVDPLITNISSHHPGDDDDIYGQPVLAEGKHPIANVSNIGPCIGRSSNFDAETMYYRRGAENKFRGDSKTIIAEPQDPE